MFNDSHRPGATAGFPVSYRPLRSERGFRRLASARKDRAHRLPLTGGSRTLSFVRDEQEWKQNRERSRLLAYLQKRIETAFWTRPQLVGAVRLAFLLDAPQGRSPVSENASA